MCFVEKWHFLFFMIFLFENVVYKLKSIWNRFEIVLKSNLNPLTASTLFIWIRELTWILTNHKMDDWCIKINDLLCLKKDFNNLTLIFCKSIKIRSIKRRKPTNCPFHVSMQQIYKSIMFMLSLQCSTFFQRRQNVCNMLPKYWTTWCFAYNPSQATIFQTHFICQAWVVWTEIKQNKLSAFCLSAFIRSIWFVIAF